MNQNRNDEGAGPSIIVKEAEESQILDIVALGEKIFSNSWNEQMVATSIYGNFDTALIAAKPLENGEEQVVGYCIFTAPCEDCELLRIAVDRAYQRQGIARTLIQHMIAICHQKQGENIFLEVRESNDAAVSLYKSMGFEEISKRKGYYKEPKEDALVMRLENISTRISC